MRNRIATQNRIEYGMSKRAPKEVLGGLLGQSTIEFILTLILALGCLMFFFQITMIFSFGSYVHYATFMAARAYLSAGENQDDQVQRATYVITSMLKRSVGQSGADKFPKIGKGFGGDSGVPGLTLSPPSQFNKNDMAFSWMQGARYTFKSRLFLISLTGFGKSAQQSVSNTSANIITLTSESWLGRETSQDECRSFMAQTGNPSGAYYDNGC
jgi:hypothetical protein